MPPSPTVDNDSFIHLEAAQLSFFIGDYLHSLCSASHSQHTIQRHHMWPSVESLLDPGLWSLDISLDSRNCDSSHCQHIQYCCNTYCSKYMKTTLCLCSCVLPLCAPIKMNRDNLHSNNISCRSYTGPRCSLDLDLKWIIADLSWVFFSQITEGLPVSSSRGVISIKPWCQAFWSCHPGRRTEVKMCHLR